MSVTVKWTGWHEGQEDQPFACQWDCILPGSWADCEGNAESAVQDICEDYFTDDVWNDEFGSEETMGNIVVEVHAPPSISGRYAVDLHRVVKASPRKLPVSGDR